MTLIVSFLVAHLGAVLGLLGTAGASLWAIFERKSGQTAKAQAAAQVAQAKATIDASNAAAAQVRQQAAAAAAGAQQQAASVPDSDLDAQLAELSALRKD
ncbi:hypothetical protein [Burkholderia sp. Bp8995]|uniref:hypothetical protein n=1 Tax=Burkholderia sp. Bp8995 TaxID=2184556 RepID=UPI000F59AB83|nr:hypothetical protein [Burkholderia sp. Bp8995]RQS22401.1 hypothetical protein DIE05_29680 [Burkholderia sp. Bp8995]